MNTLGMPTDCEGHPLPEYLRPYADWAREDFLEEFIADEHDPRVAERLATMYAWKVGDITFGAVPVQHGWVFHGRPWFADGGEVGFITSRGRKHQLIDRHGVPVGPEQRDLAGMIGWLGANGWVTL